jgi:predicted aldo/keto reductase-like oxidoreductase
MLYRTIGKTGVEASILGFGAMRLPVIGGKTDQVDVPLATRMIRHAIDGGVNYVDTAYPYHSASFGQPGMSEPAVGEALSGGYRERVNLATKLPQWFVQAREDMDRILSSQLERLRTDHLDFYLLHGLDGPAFDRLRSLGVLEFLDAARADGRIRFPAFSFHGQAEDFPRIIDSYDWAFGQMQFNYMDIDFQAGLGGLRYAAEKDVGVVVMEPIKGGKLAADLPPEMQAVFDASGIERTPAEWALRFVWNEPGVSLALSGMSTMEQVEQNLASAEHGVAGSLTDGELAAYDAARRVMQEKVRAECTACRYCQPCPSGVDIPGVISALNAAAIWNDPNAWLTGYVRVQGKASSCEECGQCEEICPQGLPVRELMKEAAGMFGE